MPLGTGASPGPRRHQRQGDRPRPAADEQPRLPAGRVRIDEPAEQAAVGQARHEDAGGPTGRKRQASQSSCTPPPRAWSWIPTTGDQKQVILDALDRLHAGGSTNGGAGIQLAYQTALDHFVRGGVNRVILCTDGDFNVGVTGTDELVRMAEQNAKTGVFLSVLGFGMGNHNDAMLEQISGQRQRQLRVHRHGSRGPQSAGRTDDRHADHDCQRRQDPGGIQSRSRSRPIA